jgi:ankyrin repeat protein
MVLEACGASLARERAPRGISDPVCTAVIGNHVDALRVILDYDPFLGHASTGLLNVAASRGHVDIARELLNHCPDSCNTNQVTGRTCLHEAVSQGHMEFVEFILKTPQFREVVNMQDKMGQTALHYAVKKCNPKMVAALLSHPNIDVTVLDRKGNSATWMLGSAANYAKTLNWVRAS